MTDTTITVNLTVNGRPAAYEVEPRQLLVEFLRETLGLSGTHIGCDEGICGACTVEIDGHTAKSCMVLAAQLDGASVVTIEGVATNGSLTDVQEAFRTTHGLQCGYCTPGMVMSVRALLERVVEPTEAEARAALAGNLCRCTGYQNILLAVQEAAIGRNGSAE